MSIKITCIKKDNGNHENPYVAISSLNWINEESTEKGTITRTDLYDWIHDKGGIAYVKDSKGNKANLEAKLSPKNNKYVRTIPDGTTSDNLLTLEECK